MALVVISVIVKSPIPPGKTDDEPGSLMASPGADAVAGVSPRVSILSGLECGRESVAGLQGARPALSRIAH